jgi:hypothetical protein
MSIDLTKIFAGISDYVAKHEANYLIIETAINDLLGIVGGGSSAATVPTGLQEIFDRDGVIGIGSYQLTNQTVVGDSLSIPGGSAWLSLSFRTKSGSTALDTSSLTTGTRYIDIDAAGLPNLADTSSVDSIYSFSWDSVTDVISNATLLVDILFDGDDYNDMLTSLSKATNYTSVADRLEAIEDALGVLGDLYAQDTGTTTGLTFGYKSGVVRNDNVISTTPASTIVLPDNDVSFIEVTPSTGAITSNVTSFTSLRVPLFEVTTSAGAITLVLDRRTWAALGGGGGGGGHAQNTDIGTDAAEFKLLNTVVGAPSSNGSFKVERGSSNDVDVRWNETTDVWEFTNDGIVYNPLGAPDLGVQELSKFVTLENPPVAVEGTAVSSTGGYTKVDLTATSPFSSIPNGVQGMLLRVEFDDSAPTASEKILIRQLENPSASPANSMRVYARDSADYNDNEGQVILTPGQGIDVSDNILIGFEYNLTASGVGTANFRIFVLGYWETVTGVGSQDVNFTHTEVVAANTTNTVNVAAFANRMNVHSISFTETGGSAVTGSDFTAYRKDTHLAADLEYQLDDISPALGAVDTLPWFHIDDDDTAELHFKLFNKDVTNSATWDIVIRGERFD